MKKQKIQKQNYAFNISNKCVIVFFSNFHGSTFLFFNHFLNILITNLIQLPGIKIKEDNKHSSATVLFWFVIVFWLQTENVSLYKSFFRRCF